MTKKQKLLIRDYVLMPAVPYIKKYILHGNGAHKDIILDEVNKITKKALENYENR